MLISVAYANSTTNNVTNNTVNNAEIRVLIGGNAVEFDVPPQIISGRTLVPMRAIFEALGAEVEWDGITQTVTAHTRWPQVIKLTVGSTEISIDGRVSQMDIAPIIQNGRTLVPVRFIAQTLGYEVFWDAANSDVLINTNPFFRLDPQPVTFTEEPISWRSLGGWIIYYLHSGGISDLEREVVRLTNLKREQHGVQPVALCEVLSAAARFKSQEMRDLFYFDHFSPVYGLPNFIPVVLFGAEHFSSENLTRPTRLPHAEAIVENLYNSPGHRENMLDSRHNVVGIGIVMSMGAGVNFDGTPIPDRYAALTTQMFGFLPPGETATPIMERYIEVYTYLFGDQ